MTPVSMHLVVLQAVAPCTDVSQLLTCEVNALANPEAAAGVIKDLLLSLGLFSDLQVVGLAALSLFALLEGYRILLGGEWRDLGMLGAKIALVAYVITGTPPPIGTLVMTTYKPFAELGTLVATQGGGQALVNLQNDLARVFTAETQMTGGNVLQQALAALRALPDFLLMLGLWLLFIVAFALVLAIYVAAVLGSRVFVLIAVLVAPLMLPLMLWRNVAGFFSKWVGLAVHAMLLPLIGAITLVAALTMGIGAPIRQFADCMSNAAPGTAGYACLGTEGAALIAAIVGAVAAVLLMFGMGRVVTSLVGSVEMSFAGVAAAKWAGQAAMAPIRAAAVARAAQAARSEMVTTRAVDSGSGDLGEPRTVLRTTQRVQTPQQ